MKDKLTEISERHAETEGFLLNRNGKEPACHNDRAYLLAEVKRLREVVEAARLFDGGNCICAYGTRGNPCRVCKLKAALAALSAMGEP